MAVLNDFNLESMKAGNSQMRISLLKTTLNWLSTHETTYTTNDLESCKEWKWIHCFTI